MRETEHERDAHAPTARSPSPPSGDRGPGGGAFDDRRYDDEISLRDLYLILLRGLPAILVVAVLAGAAAFLVSAVRPATYVAEATVTSSSPSVRYRSDPTVVLGADDDGASTLLALEPPRGISLEAYRAIALSRDVFERARERLGDVAPALDEFRGAAEVAAASGTGSTLLVHHRVGWSDPASSSTYANAWADATVERVRETLVADVAPMIDITRAATSARRDALEAAEAELMALPPGGDSAAANRERVRLERQVAEARRAYATLAELEPTITYLAELAPSGTRVLESATPPTRPSGPNTALLTALAAVLGAMVATLAVFLREAVRDPDARSFGRSPTEPRPGTR